MNEKKWWKEATVYQIYPRSFMDSSGDGIGDLPGILSKLDYIRELGADVIWLCPIYDSPNADNGYDIRDYRAIMREFGTMANFDQLLEAAHNKGLRIVMDLVVNHTSDEHEWFRKSCQAPANKYRKYYIWKDGKNGGAPNNWGGVFGGSAWKYSDSTRQYYLHMFAEKQPDLNWENSEVRRSVYDMMKWWLNKGIDGFRMDVINLLSKEPAFPDAPLAKGEKYGNGWPYVSNGPHEHAFLQEMNREVLSHYDIMTVGETGGIAPDDALRYAGFDSRELNMVFQFEHVDLGINEDGKWNDAPVALKDLKSIVTRWQTQLDGKAWNSIYWGNHDQPRAVSRFGSRNPAYREKSAKLLATLQFTLQGTPYVFQGEEIGMTNVPFTDISQYRDLETHNAYRELCKKYPDDKEKVMRAIRFKSRDNARTPMQWDSSKNAGFSRGKPWIGVNPNCKTINVQENRQNPNSVFHYYQKLIRLRKTYLGLVYGSYTPLLEDDSQVFAYLRKDGQQTFLILLNFSGRPAQVNLPKLPQAENAALLISNEAADSDCTLKEHMSLSPYEANVYLLP
ncbi:MAG: alpha-glucosidase [Oscillospiraceae bacterium]|nr:alpha-glucosidase [Oscillospiraceae bacterium]